MKNKPYTAEELRAEFIAYGITVSGWCREHGFSRMVVVDLLRGHGKGMRGEAHRAAVALGMKPDPRTKRIHHPFEDERKAA